MNERFAKARQAPVKLVLVPDALEDEDMLEMMNAGLLQAIVVDDWKAKMWAQVLPKVKVHEDVVLREPTQRWAGRSARTARSSRRRSTSSITSWVEEAGRASLSSAAVHEDASRQLHNAAGSEEPEALRADDRAVREVREAVQLRPADAGRAGLSGVHARPEREEPRRRDRRDADHAGHRARR